MLGIRGFLRIRPLEAKHQRFEADNERALRESSKIAAFNVTHYVKNRTWFRRRSERGSLKDSVTTRIYRGKSLLRITASTNKKYARPIEFGAKPHTIRPRRARVLFFYWERMGKWVWTKRVNHPGIHPPYKFLKTSTSSAAIDWSADMRARMGRISHSF